MADWYGMACSFEKSNAGLSCPDLFLPLFLFRILVKKVLDFNTEIIALHLCPAYGGVCAGEIPIRISLDDVGVKGLKSAVVISTCIKGAGLF